jgi:hypothetical protein
MNKTNTIFFGVVSVMLTLLGFFIGSIYERTKYIEELDTLVEENIALDGKVTHYENTADWNALKNIEVGAITDKCKYCQPLVSRAFDKLDRQEVLRGKLVVSNHIPKPK